MNAVLKIVEPGEVVFSMTLTMPLRQWRQVADALRGEGAYSGPAQTFREAVFDMTLKAEQQFSFAENTNKPGERK